MLTWMTGCQGIQWGYHGDLQWDSQSGNDRDVAGLGGGERTKGEIGSASVSTHLRGLRRCYSRVGPIMSGAKPGKTTSVLRLLVIMLTTIGLGGKVLFRPCCVHLAQYSKRQLQLAVRLAAEVKGLSLCPSPRKS